MRDFPKSDVDDSGSTELFGTRAQRRTAPASILTLRVPAKTPGLGDYPDRAVGAIQGLAKPSFITIRYTAVHAIAILFPAVSQSFSHNSQAEPNRTKIFLAFIGEMASSLSMPPASAWFPANEKAKAIRASTYQNAAGYLGDRHGVGEIMVRIFAVSLVCMAALVALPGCLGRFAANQSRRQAARSADYYVRTYAEPELNALYGDDPAAQAQTRQTRNDLADTIVRTGNERQTTRVGVNDRGWLTNER